MNRNLKQSYKNRLPRREIWLCVTNVIKKSSKNSGSKVEKRQNQDKKGSYGDNSKHRSVY